MAQGHTYSDMGPSRPERDFADAKSKGVAKISGLRLFVFR